MDNDNKVNENSNENLMEEKNTNQIHKEVMLFLGEELDRIHHSTQDQSYNIEKEYAKTKKHRSPFSMFMLAGCFIVVFGIAFVMTRVISSNNEEITVSLAEFDDLNLKNLLNTVGAAQTNYDNAVKNRAAIEGDMTVKLNAAEDVHKNDIFVIDSMHLRSKKKYSALIAEADRKYKDSVEAVHQEFDGMLAQADKEVEEYKKQLAEFDAAKVQAAKEKEKALDSERRVKELEQQKIKEQYESRIADLNKKLADTQRQTSDNMRQAVTSVSAQYQAEIALLDPKLNDEDANAIIEKASVLESGDFDSESSVGNVSAVVQEAVSKYQNFYDDYSYLDKAVAAIPQKNSIPSYVAASHSLVNEMGKTFANTTTSLYQETVSLTGKINELNGKIDELNGKIDELTEQINGAEKAGEEKINLQKQFYEQSYENLMTLAKTNALLIHADDYDNMPVYVAGKARYLITEEGASAEFKADKTTIKGKIFRAEDDSFYFVVGEDKEGNLLQVDFSSVISGTPVKILGK